MIEVLTAETPDQMEAVRFLVLAHATSLREHPGSDQVRADAEGLPGPYAPPRGRRYLARLDSLYRELGFVEIPRYRADELVDTVFFECDLTRRS